jgi:hypothetical protein
MQLQIPPIQNPFWEHQLGQVFLDLIQNWLKSGQARYPVNAEMVFWVVEFSVLRQVILLLPIVKVMLLGLQT